MAEYRIICTKQEPSNVPNDRAHIVAVARAFERDEFDGAPERNVAKILGKCFVF